MSACVWPVLRASSRYHFYFDSLFISMAFGNMELLFDHFFFFIFFLLFSFVIWCRCQSFFFSANAWAFRNIIQYRHTHTQRFFLTLKNVQINERRIDFNNHNIVIYHRLLCRGFFWLARCCFLFSLWIQSYSSVWRMYRVHCTMMRKGNKNQIILWNIQLKRVNELP